MGPQIPIALKSQDGLSEMIPYIQKIAQPGRWWFGIAVSLSFLFLVGFAWMRPDFNQQEIPDWRPVLARAEASVKKSELYDARSFYSRAARLASWREDWGGLLAAACGMKMLDNESSPYSNVHTILVRAMMAAESRESRAGIAAVARAFAATGQTRQHLWLWVEFRRIGPSKSKTRRTSIRAAVGETPEFQEGKRSWLDLPLSSWN